MSLDDVAALANTSNQQVSHLERGKRRLTLDWMVRLGKALDVPPIALLPARRVPVVGYVGGGAKVFAIDDAEMGAGALGEVEVDAPLDLGPDAVAVKVRGDSMRPAYRDGDLIFYDRRLESDFDSLLGEECIVALDDQSKYIKELHRGSQPGRWTLVSHNASPITDVTLIWVARVRYIERA